MNVCFSQSVFYFSYTQIKFSRIILLKISYNLGSAVGRRIVHYQNMIFLLQSEHRLNDVSDVFFFVISRYDDEFLHFRCKDSVFPLLLRSEEHTSELQSREHLVCRLLLEKKKKC